MARGVISSLSGITLAFNATSTFHGEMNLSDLAAFADVVAATAIILSLVFLGYELHQTRKQSELNNWRQLLDTLVAYKGLTHEAELADLVRRGHLDYGALSAADQWRFGLYLEQGIHIYGNFVKHNDSLPRKLVGLDDAVCNYINEMLTTPGGAAWWQENRAKGHFMPSTYKMIDTFIARGVVDTDHKWPPPG